MAAGATHSYFGKAQLWGMPAWLTWLFAHIYFPFGFRSRLTVMIDWAWAYFSFQRYARIVIAAWTSGRRQASRHPARPHCMRAYPL